MQVRSVARRKVRMIMILVRHAERLSSGSDPGLSAAGKRRAALLANMFGDANVSLILTSRFRRTRDTAAPLAHKTGLTPEVIADDSAQARTQILSGGPCVVVIGHSDTVPAFIQVLGGPSGIEILDEEFYRMFVISMAPSGAVSLLQMRYVSA